jgi:hypothetical protein
MLHLALFQTVPHIKHTRHQQFAETGAGTLPSEPAQFHQAGGTSHLSDRTDSLGTAFVANAMG